ncbi:MAG: fimbrial protein [Tannerellaceae bacterium]|nr:fimbrial protein [Tannerellaceae bacterium]
MNTGKNIFLFGIAFSLFSFISCNDEKENSGIIEEGETAYLSIKFSQPKTYAADPINATEKEVALHTVDVYVYTDNGMQNYVSLTRDDFEDLGDNVWQLKETSVITSTAGAKSVYAGINLPDAYRNVFSAAENNPEQSMAALTALNEDANGFAMFSREN